MALVNIDEWLAARGYRGSLGTADAAPAALPASPSPEQIIAAFEGEIARQADLIQRLQAALRTELYRGAALVARIQGTPPTTGRAGNGPSRVIRKRRGPAPSSGSVPPLPA